MAFRPPPFWQNSVSGIQQPNLSAFGGAGVPNLDRSIALQSARYSALPNVSQTYGNLGNNMSWWDKLKSNIDRDMMMFAASTVGSAMQQPSSRGSVDVGSSAPMGAKVGGGDFNAANITDIAGGMYQVPQFAPLRLRNDEELSLGLLG